MWTILVKGRQNECASLLFSKTGCSTAIHIKRGRTRAKMRRAELIQTEKLVYYTQKSCRRLASDVSVTLCWWSMYVIIKGRKCIHPSRSTAPLLLLRLLLQQLSPPAFQNAKFAFPMDLSCSVPFFAFSDFILFPFYSTPGVIVFWDIEEPSSKQKSLSDLRKSLHLSAETSCSLSLSTFMNSFSHNAGHWLLLRRRLEQFFSFPWFIINDHFALGPFKLPGKSSIFASYLEAKSWAFDLSMLFRSSDQSTDI